MTLTAKTALQVAADYGFSILDGQWEKSLIRDSIIQARNAEASDVASNCPRSKSAYEYFRGYMACTASEIFGETMKARQFERDAYGA